MTASPLPLISPPLFCFSYDHFSFITEGLKVSRCVRLPHYDCSVNSTCVINQYPPKDSKGNRQHVAPLLQLFHQCLYVCTSSTVFFISDSHFTTGPARTKEDIIALGAKELELSRSRSISGVKTTARVPGRRSKVCPSYTQEPLDPLTRALSYVKTR
jgi:hypothetical protein